uniref:Uncharacterized protein LOC105851531 isoform X2 n=1 Tax=Cicer arietinum TaxID=3827 RepID=A0A3Q7XDD1_CICAR|nr:uncharacterized protein LOC105851531 isoform X2 [Cicer arietinum]
MYCLLINNLKERMVYGIKCVYFFIALLCVASILNPERMVYGIKCVCVFIALLCMASILNPGGVIDATSNDEQRFQICTSRGPCPTVSKFECGDYCWHVLVIPYGGQCVGYECCCYSRPPIK